MGSERKRVRFEDEEEFIEKRKSSRVLALEKKKQQEKERKSTLEFEKRKNSTKNNAEKGKSIIRDKEQLGDFNENDKHDDPTKKECNKRALYQEISSFKAMQEGRHGHNNESTSTNASSLNNVPDKHFLENVLDILQRKDKDDLFGEPINPDTVKNYHALKKPMDFGTMRAKVVEGMYSSLAEVKRDVFLLCVNAKSVYPETSRHHKVAEYIRCHAIKVFEDLNAEHENFNMKVSPNKRCQSKKQHERQNRISPKLLGRNNVARSKVPETEKRFMCWPPCKKSLVSEFLNAKKPNIQLKISPSNYKDSLLRFVKDCGPIAQKVADKKLEDIKFKHLSKGNTFTPNIVKNVSASQLIPKATTQSSRLNSVDNMLTHTFPFVNKPLSIQVNKSRQKRNGNTSSSSVNISDGANKDKVEKGKNPTGSDVSDANVTMMNNGTLNGNLVSKLDNVYNTITQRNLSVSKQNIPISKSSSHSVSTIVQPTHEISRPQENPWQSMSSTCLTIPQFKPQSRLVNNMSSINLSRPYHMSQPMLKSYVGGNSEQSQSRHASFISDHSQQSEPRPLNTTTSSINVPSSMSLLHSETTNFPKEVESSLLCLGNPYQSGDFQDIMGSSEFNNNSFRNQVINLQGSSSSKTPEVKISRSMNYHGGGDELITKQIKANPQLSDDDDDQQNLTLNLF